MDPYSVKKNMSLLDYYGYLRQKRTNVITPHSVTNVHEGHFDVFKRNGECSLNTAPYIRKEFYKITLMIGKGILHYPNETIFVNGPALLINNPITPYSWVTASPKQSGFFCVFTENFVRDRLELFKDSILSKAQDIPVSQLDENQVQEINQIFEKMMALKDDDYPFKNDLLQNYIKLLLHEALKMQRGDLQDKVNNASARITQLFFELLENQFSIQQKKYSMKFRTAADFAEQLNIHVNHLNHAVKELTGKTTSDHISKRMAEEAIALLRHTSWNIAEIGYYLGFEYPANFNSFFKKQTLSSPGLFRQRHI